jgi:DNA-binding NtrC family response regulator
MTGYSVLVVDDDETIREGIRGALQNGCRVRTFASAEPAIEAVKDDPPDLVLLDLRLPGMSGLEALDNIRRLQPDLLVIVISADEEIASVIAAMKAGAHDYILKPLHIETLDVNIRSALGTIRLRREVRALQEQRLSEDVPCIIGESREIRQVMDFVEAVAKSPDTPVLVIGETGTGKELVAHAIHSRSPNFQGPFIAMNCASIPRELVESELFGYEKGAFSGASLSGKNGLVERAAAGTLFLDEVGDLSMEAQAKLLRFLETGEFFKLGGAKARHVSTRVVSATNKDLSSLIERGLFREDLYYRLSTVRVEVPSLNERRDDIPQIADHFLGVFNRKFARAFAGIAPDAEQALKSHLWKGNVRELRNAIERGVLIGQGPMLTLSDMGMTRPDRATTVPQSAGQLSYPFLTAEGIDLSAVQDALQMHYIKEALAMTGGNETKAASLLRMNHHTFRYHKKKLLPS